MCLFLSRWNGGSTEGMHKRTKSKGVSGKLALWVERAEVALGHLAACDLVLYWSDGWVWQGWTKNGRHATPLRGSRSTSTKGASSRIPRACDTRFDAGVRSAAGMFLDTAVQAAASFRSVVSADLPPSLR